MTYKQKHQRIATNYNHHSTDHFSTETAQDGPTILVIGGLHGGEPAGADAAQKFANAIPSKGELHVIPRINPNGLRNQLRGTGWIDDLNDEFHANKPTSKLKPHARVLWRVIEAIGPDITFDLHTSRWPRTMNKSASAGQAIYPTADCRDEAERVCDRVSDRHIRHGDNLLSQSWQDDRGKYFFTVGNTQGDKNDVALVDRVGHRLDSSAFLVEAARNGVSYEARISWLSAVVMEMCEEFRVSLSGV